MKYILIIGIVLAGIFFVFIAIKLASQKKFKNLNALIKECQEYIVKIDKKIQIYQEDQVIINSYERQQLYYRHRYYIKKLEKQYHYFNETKDNEKEFVEMINQQINHLINSKEKIKEFYKLSKKT